MKYFEKRKYIIRSNKITSKYTEDEMYEIQEYLNSTAISATALQRYALLEYLNIHRKDAVDPGKTECITRNIRDNLLYMAHGITFKTQDLLGEKWECLSKEEKRYISNFVRKCVLDYPSIFVRLNGSKKYKKL